MDGILFSSKSDGRTAADIFEKPMPSPFNTDNESRTHELIA